MTLNPEFQLILLIIMMGLIGGIAFFSWYSIADKRLLFMVRKVSGTFTRISKRKISLSIKNVKYGDKTFPFNIGKPVFRYKNVFVYMIDIESGQLVFAEPKQTLSPELYHNIMRRSLAKQLVAGLEKAPLSEILIYIILTLGLGIAFGYIIGNFVPMG